MSNIEFRILLVAEESAENLILSDAREKGLIIHADSNPRSAWKKAELSHPELLILSLDFARMEGEIFLRKFAKDERFEKTPVIILLSQADREKIGLLQELGLKEVFIKPIDSRKFMECVEKYYRRKVIREVSRI